MEIRYFLSSAFRNLWESKVTSLFTAVTLSVALGFFGAYLAMFLNMKAALGAVNEKFPLTIYLSDGITTAQEDLIKSSLKSDTCVAGFGYTSKESALKQFRGSDNNAASLIDSLGQNPLPASLDVRLLAESDKSQAERLVRDIRRFPGVEDVQYLQEEAGHLKAMFDSFRLAGLVLGISVLLGVVFISYSTLRLAVLNHSEEIEVMKLMGSTRFFIMGPFLLEGVIQGLFAAGISLGVLYGLLRIISKGPSLLMLAPSGVSFLPIWISAGVVIGGGLMGLTGSFFAFFRKLRM
ncbi:MAG: permease-like cell division protein FtsX [Nitrospirota bacterium]